jgi:hypothetical protein
MIIAILVLRDKINWQKLSIGIFFLTILLDILLHRVIGVSLLVISISCALLVLLFLIMPKKQVILSYIPYFFAIFIFYLLMDLISPFVQDTVWGIVTIRGVIGYLIKSLISTLLVFAVNTIISNFRSKEQLIV